ncbi:MAG TPA: alpha/beta hydrolase-fold protein [Cyclobacteriaceae bacterium]|nr:alpha/beta hydrolase-fold protein [Cyclobacteriaceae bacterium]
MTWFILPLPLRSMLSSGVLIVALTLGWPDKVAVSSPINPQHTLEQAIVKQFKLSIYLPPGYSPVQRYGVIYFNDGQNVFGSLGLGVEETADVLIKDRLIDPIIVVGIHSDHQRTSFYVPYEDEGVTADFGNYRPLADWYTKQIIKDIIPYINEKYSTSPKTGIAGYSFGGLQATWAALNYPDHFSFSGALSPSFWVRDFGILDEAKKAKGTQVYYFDVGTGEWNYYVPMLIKSGQTILRNVFYYEAINKRHVLADWRGARIKNILLLFAGKTDWNEYDWSVNLEVIRSEYTAKTYLRINPVITYSNGLTASISYAATYSLLNPADGVINKDGSFRFLHNNDLKIVVTYLGQSKTMEVRYDQVNQ